VTVVHWQPVIEEMAQGISGKNLTIISSKLFFSKMIETWRDKKIQASCRMEHAEGLDLENVHFLSLALQEVRQTVTETIQVWEEGLAAMSEMDQ
jgi:hypothetical protein